MCIRDSLYTLVTIFSRSTPPAFTRSMSSRKSAFRALREPNTFSSFFWMVVKLKSRFFLPIPMSTTFPPKAAASMQFWKVEGRPTASMVTSNPSPPVTASTCSRKCSGESLSSVPSRPKPVSYTHLDVYKRQL